MQIAFSSFRSCPASNLISKLLFIFVMLISTSSFSQEIEQQVSVDSLERLFRKESDKKLKKELLKELIEEVNMLSAESYYEYCPKLESYSKDVQDSNAMALINHKRGEHLYREAKYGMALEYFEKANELYFSTNNLNAAYLSKIKVGVMLEKQGEIKNAFNIYQELLNLSQNDSLVEVRASAYLNLGTHYFYRRNVDSSGLYYEQALELYEKIPDPSGVTACLNNLAINYYMKGEVDRSEETFIRLKSVHEEQGNKDKLIMVLNNLSLFNLELAKKEKALEYAIEAYEVAIKIKDNKGLINILTTIGNIYLQTQEYESAYNFILKAEEALPDLNLDNKVICLGIKGQILKGMERYDEAISVLHESIALIADHKIQVEREEEMRVVLAQCLYDKGDIEKAKSTVSELKLDKITSAQTIAQVNFLKTRLLYDDKDYRGVIKLGEPTYQELQSNKKTDLVYKLSGMLSSAYEQTNNYEKALSFSRQYQVLSDSLNNAEDVKLLTQKSKDFEFELERQSIAAEQAQKEAVLEAEAKQSRVIAGFIGFAAFLLTFFLYKNNQQRMLIADNNLRLKALNKTKDQIFSIIGHDLKKPVLAFRGLHEKFSYLIENKEHEKLLKFSKSIDADAVQLNKLTDNLLSWALLERDVLTTNNESLNLKEIVVEVINLFQPFADNKSIKFEYQMDNIEIKSDRHALSTIIRNLVDNAIKYTPEGGMVKLYTEEVGNRVQLSVQDSGIGIPEEKINDLFLLSKGKSTEGTNDEKGTGLGLHIVKELVNKVNGSIDINSRIDEGTLFTLSIPVAS